MIAVEAARNIILENTKALEPETIGISSALYRVLAEDIYSSECIPPFNNSAMDGYAVISGMLKGASKDKPAVLRIIGSLAAGSVSECKVEGPVALKIMTGAPVPQGADAVIPVEYTESEGTSVKIFREGVKWENIRFAGEDIKKGQLVIPRGKLIRPAEIGMLAALNITRAKVTRVTEISLLVTGDELVNPEEELLPGKIRNINGFSLQALALKHGCKVQNLGIAKDSKELIREKLNGIVKSNILIISGGVSVGDYDFVKNVLSEMGMEMKFWKIAIKPGKPVLFGTIKNILVFGLPGNPVSAMIAFEEFILPAIYKLQGRNKKPWTELNVKLKGTIKKDSGLTHFIRGKTMLMDGRMFVSPTGPQSSGVFSSMVAADCLIVVPEEVTEIKSGEEVLIQITDEIGE